MPVDLLHAVLFDHLYQGFFIETAWFFNTDMIDFVSRGNSVLIDIVKDLFFPLAADNEVVPSDAFSLLNVIEQFIFDNWVKEIEICFEPSEELLIGILNCFFQKFQDNEVRLFRKFYNICNSISC